MPSLVSVVNDSAPDSDLDYLFSWDISHKCLHFAGWRYCFSPWEGIMGFNSEFLDSSQARVGKPSCCSDRRASSWFDSCALWVCLCRDPRYRFKIWFYVVLHMSKAVLGCCSPAGHNGYSSLGVWTQFPLKFPNNSRLYWWGELE